MNPQLRELLIAYAITAAAMLAGLLLMRADARAYWRWPVYSAMAMALGVVSWNVLRKHLLPAHWDYLHPHGAVLRRAVAVRHARHRARQLARPPDAA